MYCTCTLSLYIYICTLAYIHMLFIYTCNTAIEGICEPNIAHCRGPTLIGDFCVRVRRDRPIIGTKHGAAIESLRFAAQGLQFRGTQGPTCAHKTISSEVRP